MPLSGRTQEDTWKMILVPAGGPAKTLPTRVQAYTCVGLASSLTSSVWQSDLFCFALATSIASLWEKGICNLVKENRVEKTQHRAW